MGDDLKGTVFNDRYRILERIGAGGMAVVYRARDEQTSTFVAVKILSRDFLDKNPNEAERNLRRFKREAEILRLLDGSPHVVRFVEHACSEGGDWFIAMELLEGDQLSHYIRRGRDAMPINTLLHYGTHLVEGLKEIHAKNIVHRDLAPDNVILVKDENGIRIPKFLDFGIGKSLGDELDQVTQMLTIMGKPQYFSPEQARGQELAASSDVYSLGVVLYQMITGFVPLEIRGIPDFKKIQKDAPRPMEDHREGLRVPPELRTVVMRCLAKSAEDRPILDEILGVLEAVKTRAAAGEEFGRVSLGDSTADYTEEVQVRTELELAEGDTINRYVIKELVGRGGMGAVYEAWDPELRRKVALKVATQIEEEEAKRRVLNEARASAALRCENIVTIYDAGTDGGTPYISMEFVEGQTLAEVIESEGPLSGIRFWELASGLCEGLALAHDREEPVIHRDLKPANVLVHRHVAKITDFGIAKVSGSSSAQSGDTGGHEVVAGTAATMSPEQINEQALDHRSDLYSLGCVLYMMATGRGPFQGNQIAIVYQHCNAEPAPPSKNVPTVPSELDRIILKLLEKAPDDRYATAADVLQDLRQLFAPAEVQQRPWHRSPVALAACGALVLAVIALVVSMNNPPAAPPEETFGVEMVEAQDFLSDKTYYVRQRACKLRIAGPAGTGFQARVQPEGSTEETVSDLVIQPEQEAYTLELPSTEVARSCAYDVKLQPQDEESDPISFRVVYDPTPPEIRVITHPSHDEPLKGNVRALWDAAVVFVVTDEDSGFASLEANSEGRITSWRSDTDEPVDSIRITQDSDDPNRISLALEDLTGAKWVKPVEIVRVTPQISSPKNEVRTRNESCQVDLQLSCPPFDLDQHPLEDGAIQAILGDGEHPVVHRDGRYGVTLPLPPLGDGDLTRHTVRFTFRGRPMKDTITVAHDSVPPSIDVTCHRNGKDPVAVASDTDVKHPKRSSEAMDKLFRLTATDAGGLAETAKVRYGDDEYTVRIGAEGSVELPEDIPESSTFPVTVEVADVFGNRSVFMFNVAVVGTSVNRIAVNGRGATANTFYVPDGQEIAVKLSATGLTATDELRCVLSSGRAPEGPPVPLTRTGQGNEMAATLAFSSREDREGTLQIVDGAGNEINRYEIKVDRRAPGVVTSVYGQPTRLPASLTVSRFPPIQIRVSDEGVINDRPEDLVVSPRGDARPLKTEIRDVEGGVELRIAADDDQQAQDGTWEIRYQTRDYAGNETDLLEFAITVRRPELRVLKAGAIEFGPDAEGPTDTQVPIKDGTMDLRIVARRGAGTYRLAIKRRGDESAEESTVSLDGTQAEQLRVRGLDGEGGEFALRFFEMLPGDVKSDHWWFADVRWERDEQPPQWQVIRNGLPITAKKAELETNGVLVSDLSQVKIRVTDDRGLPKNPIKSVRDALPDSLDTEAEAKQITWTLHKDANWEEKSIRLTLQDLAGRETELALRLIRDRGVPTFDSVTAEGTCRQVDAGWVTGSGDLQLKMTNKTQSIVAVNLKVTGPGRYSDDTRQPVSPTFRIPVSLPRDGEYKLSLYAESSETGVAKDPFQEVAVIVDTKAPTTEITYAGNPCGAPMKVQAFREFGVRARDDRAIERVEWSLASASGAIVQQRRLLQASSSGTYPIPARDLTPGGYRVTVHAIDQASNEISRTLEVTIEEKAPVGPTIMTPEQIRTVSGMDPVAVTDKDKALFYLARTEATVGQFRRFWSRVKPDAEARMERHRSGLRALRGVNRRAAQRVNARRVEAVLERNGQTEPDMPLQFVPYDVALFFAVECGGSLPTAQQWQDAGGLLLNPSADWLVYMDGGDPVSKRSLFTRNTYRQWRNYRDDGGVRPAEEPSADSPYGLRGMAGNVAEWVAENGTLGGNYLEPGRDSKTGGGLRGREPFDRSTDVNRLKGVGLRVLWPAKRTR